MVESIESFVAKLQNEGVQAGEEAAGKIRDDAQAQAEQIVQDAQAQAAKIIADAQAQAESTQAKSQNELKLAARDATMRLCDTLTQSLRMVLVAPVEAQLGKADFLASLLHEIVMAYARADSEHKSEIKVNVSPEMRKQLTDWAIDELHKAAQDHSTSIDLKDTLAQAGFEYKVAGGTVDVTVDSVVDTLAELIGPAFRELYESSKE